MSWIGAVLLLALVQASSSHVFRGRVSLTRRTLYSVIEHLGPSSGGDNGNNNTTTASNEWTKISYPVVIFTARVNVLPASSSPTPLPALPPASASSDDTSEFQLGLTLASAGVFVVSQQGTVFPTAYDQWINKFLATDEGESDPTMPTLWVFGGYQPVMTLSNFSTIVADAGFIQTQSQSRALPQDDEPINNSPVRAIAPMDVMLCHRFDFGPLLPAADDYPSFAVDGVWGLSMESANHVDSQMVNVLFRSGFVAEQTLTLDLINSVMYVGQTVQPISPFVRNSVIDWVYSPIVNMSRILSSRNFTHHEIVYPVIALRGLTVEKDVVMLDSYCNDSSAQDHSGNDSDSCSFDPTFPNFGAFLSLDHNNIGIPREFCANFSRVFSRYRPDCKIGSGRSLTVCSNASLGLTDFPDLTFVFGEDSLFSILPEHYVVMTSSPALNESDFHDEGYVVLKLVCHDDDRWPFTLGVPFLESLIVNLDYSTGSIALFQGDYSVVPHFPTRFPEQSTPAPTKGSEQSGGSASSPGGDASDSESVTSSLRLLVISGVAVVALGLLVLLVAASRRAVMQQRLLAAEEEGRSFHNHGPQHNQFYSLLDEEDQRDAA